MTTAISLIFGEDLQRDDIEQFKAIHNCIGVSGYKNTVNVYFSQLERKSLMHLALLLHRELLAVGHSIYMQNTTMNELTSAHEIYHALREEAAI